MDQLDVCKCLHNQTAHLFQRPNNEPEIQMVIVLFNKNLRFNLKC